MKKSIPVPVAVAVVAVVSLIVIAFLWQKYAPPSAAPNNSASTTAPDLQKNPNPADLAKQYGYKAPAKR